jgi:hypothetical protein
VNHAVLIEQPGRLVQVLATGDAEAEMVKADPLRAGTVTFGRPRLQAVSKLPRVMTTPPDKCLGFGRVAVHRALRDLFPALVWPEALTPTALTAAGRAGHDHDPAMCS